VNRFVLDEEDVLHPVYISRNGNIQAIRKMKKLDIP
jgi:hypothetical protein